jgi:cellulose synthase operon protein C
MSVCRMIYGLRTTLMAVAAATMLLMAPIAASAAKSANDRSYEFYEDALRLFNKKDYRAAVIQLKNALQQDHRNISARVLLGKSHLRLGNGQAAEKQLTLARTTGADENLTLVPYGRSLLVQGKTKRLLKEIPPANRLPDIEAEIRFMRGQANLDQRQYEDARGGFLKALEIKPDHGESILGMARLMLILGKTAEANQFAERALKVASKDADTWYIVGEIMRQQRKFAVALRHYGSAINISDQHLPARLSRAAVLLDLHRYDDALEDVNYIRGIAKRDPQTLYLYALIMSQKKKPKEAQDALRLASNIMDERDPDFMVNHPPSMLLRGLINYSRRNFNEAYPLLSRYVDLIPTHVGARKLLGALLMRRKEPTAAVKILEPAAKRSPSDPELATLLGSAYMANKQFAEARKIFERAEQEQPYSATVQTRLALSKLALGDQETAIEHLKKAVDFDSKIGRAEVLLGMLQIKKGNYDAAITTAYDLARKEPQNPFPHNLAGAALMWAGERKKAQMRFLKALKLAPAYAPAKYNLASLYLSERKTGPARKLYMELLKQNKNDTRVMIELSKLAEGEGRIKEAIDWLDQVTKLKSKSIPPQIRLLSLLLRAGRNKDALLIADELENRYPTNQNVLEAKGRVLIATGENGRAVEIFRQASYLSRNRPEQYFQIAKYQMKLNDFTGAQKSLQSVISLDPGHLPAHSALVNIEIQLGGVEKALELALAVQTAYPKSPVGDLLTGDLLMRGKRYSDAAAAYRAGLKKAQGPTLAVRLYQVRRRLGESNAALADLDAWNTKHPGYAAVHRVLASAYMNTGQTKRATDAHIAYVKKHPKDARMINNLALLYQDQNDGKAIEFAERALKLDPENASVLDTYGWILVQRGDAVKGLRYLREAQTRAAKQLDVRYHIAVALNKLGRNKEAKRELEAILGKSVKYQSKQAAQALYKRLQ